MGADRLALEADVLDDHLRPAARGRDGYDGNRMANAVGEVEREANRLRRGNIDRDRPRHRHAVNIDLEIRPVGT